MIAQLGDFDLSYAAGEFGFGSWDGVGIAESGLGSPLWESPELLLGLINMQGFRHQGRREPLKPDAWALGITFYD